MTRSRSRPMPNDTLFHDPAYAPCHRCGYDLRATAGDTCPECGAAVDGGPAKSAIPWAHRASLGQLNAYLRTLWLVTVHPARVAADASRPQLPRDGRTFAWATTVAATIPGAAIFIGYALARDGLDLKPLLLHFGPTAVWPELVVLAAVVAGWAMFAAIVTRIQVYGFDRRHMPEALRGRAVTLGRYCSAGWGFVVVPLAALASIRVLLDLNDAGLMTPGMIEIAVASWVVSSLLLVGIVMRSTLVVLTRLSECRWPTKLAIVCGLPATYALAAGLCLVVFPGLCLFAMLMALSLR